MRKVIVIVIFGLAFLAEGCQNQTKSTNNDLLNLMDNDPCGPPCWEGIVPGVSTESDVITLYEELQQSSLVDKFSTKPPYYFAQLGAEGLINTSIGGDVVNEIFVALPQLDYRVEQLIEQQGEPDAYVSELPVSGGYCSSCEGWNDSTAYPDNFYPLSYLLYPTKGLTVQVRPGAYSGCVCPKMLTGVFYFYEPTSINDALKEEISSVFARNDFSFEDIVLWHGYNSGY